MSRPVNAETLLQLDKRLEVVKLQCYPIPEQVVWQAGRNDYSEVPIHNVQVPSNNECGKWIVNTLLANERGHYGCYSSDTQVLTDSGWVYWPEVTKDTVLAAYNTETGVVTFETPSAVQRWDYKGKMYHLEGQALDFLVSPDHRMIVQTKESDGNWSQLKAISAEELYNHPQQYRFTTSGNLSVSQRKVVETPIDNPRFWALVGYWLGGALKVHKGFLKALKLFKVESDDYENDEYESSDNETNDYEYLELLCYELSLRDFKAFNGDFLIESKELLDWFPGLYRELPEEYLYLNKDCVNNLLEGVKESEEQYSACGFEWGVNLNDYLSSQLQALAAVNDLRFTLVNDYLRYSNQTSIVVDTTSNEYKQEWVDYEGQIHCATVSTGALIVRRNDKVAVCGNCLEHPQITFSCSGFVHNVVVQGRTHRIGTSWDVQSQRYTGKRVLKVANNELDVEDVFYVRPAGFYVNRQGKKYEWTEEHRQHKLARIIDECREYAEFYQQGFAEEHIRDYLPQAIRQNFVVSFNLRSVLHFLDLRAKLDAQLEIEALCSAFVPELQKWAPNVWNYYEEKRYKRAKLSP